MDPKKTETGEDVKKSEMVQIVMETEAEAGVSGISVSGGGKSGLFIKDVQKDSPAAKSLSLQEGDQILSAKVYFDNVKYEDALQILQCAEPYKISFCLKRNVQSADVSMSPGSGTFEVKGPKAKMPKMTVKSLKTVKKVKSLGKSSKEGTLREAEDVHEEISAGKIDITPVDVEFSLPKFGKFRKVKGLPATESEGASPDLTVKRSSSDAKVMRLKLPRMKVKEAAAVEGLALEVRGPSGKKSSTLSGDKVDTKGLDVEGKVKAKSPRFGISLSKSKKKTLPKTDIEVKEDIKFKAPQVELDVSVPTSKADVVPEGPVISGKGESFHLKMPTFGTTSKALDVEVKPPLPLAKGEVEVESPEGKPKMLTMPKFGVSLHGLESEVDGSGTSIRGLEEKANIGIQLPSVEIAAPEVDFDLSLPNVEGAVIARAGDKMPKDVNEKGEGFQIKMPKFGVSAKVPKVDMDMSLSKGAVETGVEKPEFKMPEMKASKIEISFPKGKAEGEMGISAQKATVDSDIPAGKYNTGIRLPSLDISAPKLDVDITLPKGKQEFDGSSDHAGQPPEPNIEIPDVTIKMPKISLPKFGIKSKEDHLDAHAVSSNVHGDMTLTKHGEIEVESPDMKTKGPKIKMPSFGLSLTKGKHDVSAPQVEIKTKEPEVAAEGKFKFPDIKMPSIDIAAPEVADIELPKANIEISGTAGEGKIKSYQSESLERPDVKFKLPSVSLSKFDTTIESERPKMDVKMSPPKIGAVAKITNWETGLKDGDLEMHTGKLSIPKVDISVPKIKPMELEVSSSKGEVDLSIGKPKLSEKHVNVDTNLKSHDLEIESSKKKIDFSSVKMPALNIDVPKVDLDINLPQAKTEFADYEIDEPDAKWKMPKVSLPTFHGQEKNMDVQHDVSSAKLGVDLKTPHVDVDVKGADLTGKLGGITMPKIGISFPKSTVAQDDEMELRDPELMATIDKKLPKVKTGHDNAQGSLEAKLQLPSVILPSVEILTTELSDVDIKTGTPKASLRPSGQADVAVEVSGEAEGKWKSHKFSLPKFGMSGSKTKKGEEHVKAPELEGEADIPDVTVKGPRLKMPKFGISFPKAKLDLESSADVAESSAKTDLKGPKGQVAIAGSKEGLDSVEAKIKLPTVALPQVGVAVPKVDIDLKGKDNGHIEGDNEFPSAGGIQAPEINIQVPDVQLEMPTFSLPTVGGKAKEGDLDIDRDSSKASAKAKIEVSADGSLGGSEVTVADGKVKIKEGKMKMPKFRIPSFNMSKKEVDVSGGKVEGDVSPPEMNVKLKKGKAKVSEPELDVETPDGKVKLSFMKMPKFKMASPKGKALGSDLKVSAQADGRGSEEDLQGPNLHMKMPQISLPEFRGKEGKTDIGAEATLPKETSNINLKPGIVKMPSLEILAPSVKPDIEIPIPKTTVDFSGEDLREYKQDLKMPSLDVSAPSLELDLSLTKPKVGPLLQQEGKGEVVLEKSEVKLQMPRVELPSIGLPDLRGRGAGFEGKEAEVHLLTGKKEKVSAITLKPQKVRLDSDGTEGSSEEEKATLKGSKIKIPTLDISLPKVRNLDADIPFADANVDIEGPGFRDVEGRFSLPSVTLPRIPTPHIQAPELEIDVNMHKDDDVPVDPGLGKTHFEMKVPDVELSGPDMEGTNLKFKMPKMKMPTFGGSSTEGKGSESEHAEGGIRGVKIKMPKLQLGSLKGKTEGSEAIAEGEVKIKETATDIKSHDLETHGGKIKFKVPTVGISVGGGEVKERDADMQPLHPINDEKELKIRMPKISIPDVGFTESEEKVGGGYPGAEFKVDAKLKAPKVQSPKSAGFGDLEVDLGLSDAKMKMPHMKVPSIGISGWKGKSDDDMTVSLGSKADFHAEELEGRKSHFKMPDVEFSGPKIKSHGEYEIEHAMVEAAASKDKEAVGSPVTISGKLKADKKDGIQTLDTEEEDDDAGKKYQVKFPKFGISLPKVGMEGDSENPELKGLGGVSLKPGSAEHETEKQVGKVKMPKVKKAVFVMMKSKEKGTEATSGLLESDVDSKPGTLEIDSPTADVKIKLPKIKKKPSFGRTRSKQKGAEVNGDFDASARDDSDAKASKMKFPKLGFSNSKTDSLDVNVNGSPPSSSSPQLNGDHEASLENDSQDNRVKLAKLKFPKLEFSSPYKAKEQDSEMNLKLVRTEEHASKDEVQGSIKGTKFKPAKMSFSGFKKKTDKSEDIEGSTNIVKSSARTEMASMEKEGEGESKSGKSKISIGFFSSKSRGEYIVDNSGGVSKSESIHIASYEGGDADSKEKTARFKFPKISLGQKSQGMVETTSEHKILEKGAYIKETGAEEGMSGFTVSLPQVGFSTSEEHTSEEHITTDEGGSILRMTQTKRVKTETGPETSTVI